MKKFLQKRKRKGFTLVELLIVIIIIGILAGSMLLVMGAGKDKAEATKIVSNLRSMKAAAIMCYADTDKWPTEIASISPYMDATINTTMYAVLPISGTADEFYIGYAVSDDTGVSEKLANMASDVRLYGNGNLTTLPVASTDFPYTAGDHAVWVQVK